MAVLARINALSQMRYDLQHVIATDSFNAYDYRAFSSMFSGINKNYVIAGLEITSVSGLSVSISVKNSFILMPLDDMACFYAGTGDDPDETILVPPATQNVFVEAYVEKATRTPVTTAFFDPGATTEQNPAGNEFTASVNFQEVITLNFRFKTDGFSVDAIPVAKLQTNSTSVTQITDSRDLFFRLASGGASPDQFHKFPWSTAREENQIPGNPALIGQLNIANPYFVSDANGAKNDKAIRNLKAWMDAVMTVLAEIKGTPTWYFPTNNKTVPNLLFLTGNATTIIPNPTRTLQWSREGDGKLRTKGSGTPIAWAMNFGPVVWTVGGAFVSSTSRAYASNDWECTISDGRSVFIRLERETRPSAASGSPVKWGVETAISSPSIPVAQTVKGQEGDFTGIAVGDYIRKEGEDYFQYNKVTGVVESGILNTTVGYIATPATTALQVEQNINVPSTEPFRWFRAAYSSEDLFVSTADGLSASSNSVSPLTIPVDDINMYWFARRNGSVLVVRNYGNMSAGEDVPIMEDSDAASLRAFPEMFLKIDSGAYIDGSGNLSSLNSNVLTIQKMKTDNTVSFGSNNTDAWQTYTIANSVSMAFTSDEDGLWVRLDDSAASDTPIVAGTVNPSEPTVPTNNVLQIIPVSSNPQRSYRNRNVFLIARRITRNGVVSLQFFDGKILQAEGISLETDITKVVTGVSTSTTLTTPVSHGFQRNTKDFLWAARRTSTDRNVALGATNTNTGLTLDATPGGVENLTIVFSRHVP